MSKLILIADDQAGLRDVLSSMLVGRGYDVETAEDGLQAMDRMAHRKPDLILLDIAMPHMSGLQVAAKIREDSGSAEIPIFFISSLADDLDGYQNQTFPYKIFPKPLDFIGLLSEIEKTVTV